jgi:hypothetical protein
MPLLFLVLSVRQTVKARCIDSAVISTNVFTVSPSPSVTFRNFDVKSGLLSNITANLASVPQTCSVAGRIRIPYFEWERAVMHVLSQCKLF